MNNLNKLVKESKKVTKELEGLLPKPPKKKRNWSKSIKRVVGAVAFPAMIFILIGLGTWGIVEKIQHDGPTVTEISKLDNGWYEITAEDGRTWVSDDGNGWVDREDFDSVNNDLRRNLDEAFSIWNLQKAFNTEQEK